MSEICKKKADECKQNVMFCHGTYKLVAQNMLLTYDVKFYVKNLTLRHFRCNRMPSTNRNS